MGTALLLVIAAAALTSCGGPGLYPTILTDPAPREETTMTPDQVKQATDTLIADRQRLCTEAVAAENDRPARDALAKCSTNQTP